MEYILLFLGLVLVTFAVSAAAMGMYERGTRNNRGWRPGSL